MFHQQEIKAGHQLPFLLNNWNCYTKKDSLRDEWLLFLVPQTTKIQVIIWRYLSHQRQIFFNRWKRLEWKNLQSTSVICEQRSLGTNAATYLMEFLHIWYTLQQAVLLANCNVCDITLSAFSPCATASEMNAFSVSSPAVGCLTAPLITGLSFYVTVISRAHQEYSATW